MFAKKKRGSDLIGKMEIGLHRNSRDASAVIFLGK